MKRGDELTLTLDAFAFEGKSIARHEGMVVFVKGGVPGDEVRVRLRKIKKQFLEADTVDVLTPSGLRAEPRCRYFGTCGGCKWQDVSYDAQLVFKRQHVIDALERIGGFHDVQVHPTIGSDRLYFYRNKMEFSFGERWLMAPEWEMHAERPTDLFALGLHIPQRFDKVLDLEECWLQSERSFRIVNLVRTFCREQGLSIYSTHTHTGYLRNLVIRESTHTGELMVNIVTAADMPEVVRPLTGVLLDTFPFITTVVNNVTERKSQVAIGEVENVYHGSGFINETIGGNVYRISANSFFQTNTLQAEKLYNAAGAMARLEPDDVVFDLYSGTGTIALHIAKDVKEVIGIEAVKDAVEDARSNAAQNKITNCRFLLGDLKQMLTGDLQWREGTPLPTVIITDPPRSGMHEKVIEQMVRLKPERIVYVSCNPATQARDLSLVCKDGSYSITDVQPVDMFPHTYHIENIVTLQATSGS